MRTIVLHSPLPTYEVAELLRQSIDEQHLALFSSSGYKGKLPVLGTVGDNDFRLQKRRQHKNSFAPFFYGRFEPEPGGTRIEGYFDISGWVKLFMRLWMTMAIAIGGLMSASVLRELFFGSRQLQPEDWVAVVIPAGLVLFGILLPKLGRLLGRGEERFLLEHLRVTVDAREERSGLFTA